MVSQLEKTHDLHNRVAVEIVKFQVMAAAEHIDVDQVYQTLLRMVNMTVLTDESFKVYVPHSMCIFRALADTTVAP